MDVFFNEDDDLLEKYNTIWDKVSFDIKKEFDSEPVYNKKALKTNIKSYDNEVADFLDKEIPKVGSDCTCLAVITIGSDLKKGKNYYSQVFLKECKCIEKEVTGFIIGGLETSSDESDEE